MKTTAKRMQKQKSLFSSSLRSNFDISEASFYSNVETKVLHVFFTIQFVFLSPAAKNIFLSIFTETINQNICYLVFKLNAALDFVYSLNGKCWPTLSVFYRNN